MGGFGCNGGHDGGGERKILLEFTAAAFLCK